MDSIPNEIIYTTLSYLDLENLMNLTKINKFFNNFIKSAQWMHLTVKLHKLESTKHCYAQL